MKDKNILPHFQNLYVFGHWVTLQLDYQTGSIKKYAFYQANHSISYCDSLSDSGYNGDGTFRLTEDGKFVYARPLRYGNACRTVDFMVIRLDSNLNVLPNKMHEFSYPSSQFQDYGYTSFNANGKLGIYIAVYGNMATKYYAIIGADNEVSEQRKLVLNNNGAVNSFLNFPGYGMQNLASINIQSMDSIQFFETSPYYSSSAYCSGEDTGFLSSFPLLATRENFDWQASGSKTVTRNKVQVIEGNFVIDTLITCQQKSICGPLKINSDSNFCLTGAAALLSVTKNTECLKIISWSADTSLISILNPVNDTTISLQFKNTGKGYLYAAITSCGIRDSILLTVEGPALKVSLGNDTTLCQHSSDTLRPLNLYQDYLWQDGSKKPVYIVQDTGTYYVSVTDYCQNISSDTIVISYENEKLSAGPDIQVCKSQDTQLSATAGFNNYHWQPENEIVGKFLRRHCQHKTRPDNGFYRNSTNR